MSWLAYVALGALGFVAFGLLLAWFIARMFDRLFPIEHDAPGLSDAEIEARLAPEAEVFVFPASNGHRDIES